MAVQLALQLQLDRLHAAPEEPLGLGLGRQRLALLAQAQPLVLLFDHPLAGLAGAREILFAQPPGPFEQRPLEILYRGLLCHRRPSYRPPCMVEASSSSTAGR